MRKVRKTLLLMTVLMGLAVSSCPILAEENTENSSVTTATEESTTEAETPSLKIDIASETVLTENDTFQIVIKSDDGDEKNLNVNVYECYYEPEEIDLTEGTYEVTDLKYTGDNKEIKNGCYAIRKEFTVEKGITVTEEIMIGEIQIASMDSESLLIRNGGKIVATVDPYATEVKTETDQTEEEPAEEETTENQNKTEITTETVREDPDDSEVIEKKEKDTEDQSSSSRFHLVKLLPILIVALTGAAGIFIYGKRH